MTAAKILNLKLLYAVFGLSGMCALLYQLSWQRLLFLTYGTNSEATTAIVAVFMLGLGLGSLAGGELSKRRPDSLLMWFAGVEAGIGLFGLISVPLLNAVGQATAGIDALQAGAMCFAILVVPTMLMGATLPLLVAHIVAQDAEVGDAVGDLYHVNTLGSALVCIMASFFIFRWFGLSGAVHLGAVGNFAVAGTVFFAGRR